MRQPLCRIKVENAIPIPQYDLTRDDIEDFVFEEPKNHNIRLSHEDKMAIERANQKILETGHHKIRDILPPKITCDWVLSGHTCVNRNSLHTIRKVTRHMKTEQRIKMFIDRPGGMTCVRYNNVGLIVSYVHYNVSRNRLDYSLLEIETKTETIMEQIVHLFGDKNPRTFLEMLFL